jgi:DNA-binding LytR/AlgR family response regulator
MNCIIVDDEVSCKNLEEYIVKYSSINLVGSFFDPASAMDQLSQRDDIDLVFIDIKFTGIESLDFIGKLKNQPNIIVISSTDEYAVKTFDYNVVDYLLKPVTYPRFCRAVDKTVRYFLKRESSIPEAREIFIKKGSSLIKLKLKEIVFIEALENYVTLFTGQEKFTIHFTMKGIDNQLPQNMFTRVHKSYIVNKTNIKTIKENSLDLIIGKERKNIPVGQSFRDSLLSQINIMNR